MKNSKVRVNYLLSAQIIRCLWDGPNTVHEIVEQTGGTYGTTLQYIRALKAAKLVRQKGKVKDVTGRCTLALWEWAPDKPDIKHKSPSPAARSKLNRDRKKANEVHRRLTLLGTRAGDDPAQEGGGQTVPLDRRPHPGGEQVV